MDLCATPAVELARLIRSRELSATELLAAVLSRIGTVNPGINAIITLVPEHAADVAAGLDEQAARGSFAGPPARPADRGEGPGRDRGDQDDVRLADLRVLRPVPRRAARGPGQAGGRGGDRQDQRAAGMAPLLRSHREQVKATLAWNIEKGVALGGEQVAAARARQAEIFGRVRSFLADGPYDVLALPTVQVLPFPVEQEWVTEINGEPMATYIDWMRSCSRITVSAHPAVSVPAGLTAAGPGTAASTTGAPATAALPVGLQLVGRYGDDRRLLEIAAAVMELTGPG
jgi:Asp-tRNA(Asn)/Glu-tRNA(Gln) amidotransferase A subunit family amidase